MQPLTARSLVDQVTHEVKTSILGGDLPPGSVFSIVDLSTRLGVSHIPVREALRRLEGEGLVMLRPGRSAVVAPVTVAELEELYDLRKAIEVDVVGRAARLYTDADLAMADQCLEYLNTHERPATLSIEYWQVHRDLHWALLRPAAGGWTKRMIDLVWQAGDRYTRLVYEVHPVSRGTSGQRHAGLVEAAHRGTPSELRRLWTEHLAHNREYMKKSITAMLDPAARPRPRKLKAG
jgi:DNA-binding GntR family transcriptional regulator